MTKGGLLILNTFESLWWFVNCLAGLESSPEFVECVVMGNLSALEQFLISERVNFTNHNLHVEITLLDKITQVSDIKGFR